MALTNLIQGALGPILDGVLKLIPDKNERARAKEKFEAEMLTAMTGLVQGQLEINKVEAQHGSIFVAGWRPAIGWICGSALGWNFIIQPIITWAAFISGVDMADAPRLDTGELTTILLGMLGLGGLRTYEKRLGVARPSLKAGGD
jgi:hypothetical protein